MNKVTRNLDDINIFTKNEKEQEILMQTIRIDSLDKKNRIWDLQMCHADNEKRRKSYKWRNRTIQSRTLVEKKLQISENIRIEYHQKNKDERKS